MIGENLRSITKIDEDKVCITTKERTHIYQASGEYGHEAWITSVPDYCFKGIIREFRNDDWKLTIITDGGYNDIELRVEMGYCGEFSKIV